MRAMLFQGAMAVIVALAAASPAAAGSVPTNEDIINDCLKTSGALDSPRADTVKKFEACYNSQAKPDPAGQGAVESQLVPKNFEEIMKGILGH